MLHLIHQQVKHLRIALGESCYVSLPRGRPLVTHHCIISTLEHSPAVTDWDDSALDELAVRSLTTSVYSFSQMSDFVLTFLNV